MKLSDWLRSERGRQIALAKHLNITQATVGMWCSGVKDVPIRRMAAIEEFTRGEVTRKDMCPDEWEKIWPELASGNDTNHDQSQSFA